MKVFVTLVFAACVTVCAQTSSPAPAPAPAQAQTGLPDLPDSAVVAIFPDKTTFTMGDVRKYINALPPESQPMAIRDPKTWVEGWSRMVQMARLAEKDKLDERSPTREQIEFQRLFLLASAEGQDRMMGTPVEGSEIIAKYEATKEKYKQVKVNAIYISFGDKGVSEAQAKSKAEKLLVQVRKGANFAKLARENSDDETSKAKDGYFATLTPSDNIPDALRAAVFQLKQGDTSEPVRQPNGFYLLRAEQVSYKALADVRDQIFSEIKNQKFQDWLTQMAKEAEPTFPNPKFPGGGK
jgi:peptidyl-prolyl cis-trans isomerase C